MKKYSMIFVAALFVLFAGCSILGMKVQKVSQVKEATGKVTINYTLTRISGMASNQYAVWIEDEAGRYVRTLFVTDYMARRQGWKVRQQSLTTWVKVADVKNTPQEKIDAVSGATPKSGNLSVVWDMKDITGKAVISGVYVYRIEGSLLWEKTVLWTGKIHVGGTQEKSQAIISYFPEGADKVGKTLISDVSAVYEPTQ
jgi:hypothetical protein